MLLAAIGIDGAKALRKAIRRTFGKRTPFSAARSTRDATSWNGCPSTWYASVRRTLRQAWELDDADKAEKLIRNLTRRLEQVAPGVSASILEGMDKLLMVVRLRLPPELRRSLACTNIIENMVGGIRRVCRNVKRWRDAPMALRWTGAAMQEAAKGFRRLKAHKQLPALRAALAALGTRPAARCLRLICWLRRVLSGGGRQASFSRVLSGGGRQASFNRERDNPAYAPATGTDAV